MADILFQIRIFWVFFGEFLVIYPNFRFCFSNLSKYNLAQRKSRPEFSTFSRKQFNFQGETDKSSAGERPVICVGCVRVGTSF